MYKEMKKNWGAEISSLVPLNLWHRLLNIDLILPYYHVVSDQELEHISGLFTFRTVQQFEADIEFILRFYTPISLEDIICYLDGTRRLPKRCFLLTFDDGFREIYDIVAPILYARGIPAVFFVTTAFVDNYELCYQQKMSLLIRTLVSFGDSSASQQVSQLLDDGGIEGTDISARIRGVNYHQRHLLDSIGLILNYDFTEYANSVQPYLTSKQIKNLMMQGFDIGSHSIDHPLYSELSLEEQLRQTHESLSWLSNHFQFNCQAFAFPFRDVGVSPEFFQMAFADGRLKVSFGTGGMHCHYFPRNMTRNTMENTNRNAKLILAREFAVTFLGKPPWPYI